ncbi:hypothetical protein V7S43_014576 [Phytophthora oleae]|uniref:Uncharacterized protein n=1 Tax=Phytophthora oleae TaxID=2107226 RepID=A0ABD3F0Z3_9STRA
MEIVAVDRSLQLSAVDEDESEAVAICCVEFLLSETNAYYQQKCINRDAIQSVSSCLRDNILDTVFAAALESKEAVEDSRFKYESRPEAELNDRHAVRNVPSKSIEKPASIRSSLPLKTASSPASRAGSSPDKLRTRIGARRRRKPSIAESDKTPPVQTFELEGDPDYEKPEIKEWREKCLKSLETSTKKPGFAKWVNLARVFSVPENRVSMEVGVIASTPANIVEALAATPVQTKTNIDSFSSILDPTESVEAFEDANNSTTRRTRRRSSAVFESTARNLQPMSTTIHSIAEVPQRQAKRLSQSANTTDSSLQRKATLLTDSLSRRKLTRKPSTSESLSGNANNALNSSRSLWRYEQEAGSATNRTFVTDGSEFNASTFPTTMSVASGVVLLQGENVVEGPGWVENAATMSRKRFDLQQQLAADAVLNSPSERDLNSPRCSSVGSPLVFGHYSASPLSELHFRDYEEVPPEPIPIPQLSPISSSTLAIPRTHLNLSLSTPSLRVRTSVTKAGGPSSISGENGTSSSGHNSLGITKPRPTTALRALAASPSGRTRATSAAPGHSKKAIQSLKSAGTPTAKYLREFPKPNPGVIRLVRDQATGFLNSEEPQRTAWMS